MKNLKYVGHYDRQSYLKSDFTRHGVSDEAARQISWDPGQVHQVEDELADFVMQHHPGNFVEVDDDGFEDGAERGVASDFSNDDHNNISLTKQVEDAPSGSVAQGVDDAPTGKGSTATSRGKGATGGGSGTVKSSKSSA